MGIRYHLIKQAIVTINLKTDYYALLRIQGNPDFESKIITQQRF